MSGGHYPSSYHHIQPSQEFIAPRHRLPLIPPQRPPSSYNPTSISHAHASHSWMNKNNFQNFHENATSFYSQTSPKNYSPRGILNEENKWSEPPFSNSPSVTNASYRCSPETDGMESRISTNAYSKEDVQQESMDLSPAAHVPTITSPKANPESDNPVNGNPNDDRLEKDLLASVNGATPKADVRQTSSKIEAVSVIAPNPLREQSGHIVSVQSIIKTAPSVPHEAVIKCSKESIEDIVKIAKQEKKIIPPDHVESILETMFHSDSKSCAPSTVSSVIVTAQSCKSNDLRAESVEKILKSPSPERSDNLSLESDSELNSSEMDSTKGENNAKTDLVSECKIDSGNLPKSNDVDDGLKKGSEKPLTSKTECLKSDTQAESSDSLAEKIGKTVDEDLGLIESEDESESGNDRLTIATDSVADLSNKIKNNKTAESEYLKKLEEDCIVVEVDLEKGKKQINEFNIKTEGPKNKKSEEEITYVEVESELEKMFAGIEESGGDPLNALQTDASITDTSKLDASNVTTDVSFSQPVIASDNLPAPTKTKKKSSKKSKSGSNKKDAKSKHSTTSRDNASSDGVICKRVPVIHVEGSKENPISVQIINSIKSEEDDISDAKTAAKRKQGKCDKVNKRFAASYSVKNYDPESSDESWVCIFCKQSAHSPGVAGEPTGELFGPYFIKDPFQPDTDTDSKRHSRKTDHFNDQIKKKKLKKKRSLSLESNHNVSSIPERKTMEIWAHENCFIWASGIHLVGSKLMGLENAVIESLQTICAHCNESGASIGCRTRHCRSFVHYSCALYTGWKLDSETFIAVCNLHKGTQ